MTLSAEVCHGFSDLFGTCHAVGVRQGWTFPSVVYARTAWTRWSSMTFSWASSRVLLAVALWIHHGPGSNHIMAKRHEITISWPYEVKSVVQLACMRSHGGVRARTVYIYIYIYMAMFQKCSEHEQLMGQMLSPDAFFVCVSCSWSWGKSTLARDKFGPSPKISWLLGDHWFVELVCSHVWTWVGKPQALCRLLSQQCIYDYMIMDASYPQLLKGLKWYTQGSPEGGV